MRCMRTTLTVATIGAALVLCACSDGGRATISKPSPRPAQVERAYSYSSFSELRTKPFSKAIVVATAGAQTPYTESSAAPLNQPMNFVHTKLESVRVIWGTVSPGEITVTQTPGGVLQAGSQYLLFLTSPNPDTTMNAYAILEGVGYRLGTDNVYRLIGENPGALPTSMQRDTAEAAVKS